MRKNRIAVYLSRFLGAAFILSGVMKALNQGAFEYEIMLYTDAFLSRDLLPLSGLASIVISAVEIALGAMCWCKRNMLWPSMCLMMMLAFFTWLTSVNLFYPPRMGSIETCGCFGELIHFTPKESFYKASLLFIVSVVNFVLLVMIPSNRMEQKTLLWKERYTWLACLFGLCMPLYSYLLFGVIRMRYYLPIYVLLVVGWIVLLYVSENRQDNWIKRILKK